MTQAFALSLARRGSPALAHAATRRPTRHNRRSPPTRPSPSPHTTRTPSPAGAHCDRATQHRRPMGSPATSHGRRTDSCDLSRAGLWATGPIPCPCNGRPSDGTIAAHFRGPVDTALKRLPRQCLALIAGCTKSRPAGEWAGRRKLRPWWDKGDALSCCSAPCRLDAGQPGRDRKGTPGQAAGRPASPARCRKPQLRPAVPPEQDTRSDRGMELHRIVKAEALPNLRLRLPLPMAVPALPTRPC